ncbi:MAG TPA: efflux transporter outer membrane subunit [Cellvibrionaceae bacterium]|nr:efflux transporter outer membrane subunit [Cellvibrionaceae bacterium]HNG58712.1 efflux transporter outer membrane subunit [Cellvibrionaceae bacterium]
MMRLSVGALALVVQGALLLGCSAFKPLNTQVPAQQAAALAAQVSLPRQAQAKGDTYNWWVQFNDATLNQLMQDAWAHNNSLQIASSALDAARALYQNAQRDRLPSTQMSASEIRRGLPQAQTPQGSARINTQVQAQFDSQWELDLFGRLRNQAAFAKAQASWAEADLAAVRSSISAEVAAVYVQLRSAQLQLRIAAENRQTQAQTFDLTKAYAQVGRSDALDVARAEAQFQLTQANEQQFSAQVNTHINRLAVLTGNPMPALKEKLAAYQNLPNVPAQFDLGDTQALIAARPDIRKAEQKARAALANYNVQVADLYPSIQLTGGLGFVAADWNSLGNSGTDSFYFGPRLRWGAFDFGRVQARIKAADAQSQIALRQLDETLLTALEEIDNAMVDFGQEELRRNGLQKAQAASLQAAKAAREKFTLGVGDLSTVLDVERSHLAVSAEYAQSEARLLLDLIRIYKSLGTGRPGNQQDAVARSAMDEDSARKSQVLVF